MGLRIRACSVLLLGLMSARTEAQNLDVRVRHLMNATWPQGVDVALHEYYTLRPAERVPAFSSQDIPHVAHDLKSPGKHRLIRGHCGDGCVRYEARPTVLVPFG
jgi:hypothetical protein